MGVYRTTSCRLDRSASGRSYGLLVLALRVRTGTCVDVSGRLCGCSEPVRAAARTTWPTSCGPVHSGRPISIVSQPLLSVADGHDVPCSGMGRRCAFDSGADLLATTARDTGLRDHL